MKFFEKGVNALGGLNSFLQYIPKRSIWNSFEVSMPSAGLIHFYVTHALRIEDRIDKGVNALGGLNSFLQRYSGLRRRKE